MTFLEKNLEDIVYDTSQYLVFSRGLDCYEFDIKLRQLNLGAYGIADIVTAAVSINNNTGRTQILISVYELKKDAVDMAAFLQGARYVRGIQHYLSHHDLSNVDISYRIILIGSSTSLSCEVGYFPHIFSNLYIYSYSYEWNGIWFSRNDNIQIIDPGFSSVHSETARVLSKKIATILSGMCSFETSVK